MLNSARMCLPGQVLMTGMLLNTLHPSFFSTANTSCSIRESFKIHIFKLPYQNVRITVGRVYLLPRFSRYVFCAILKRWLLLKACCTLLVGCRCLYRRSFLPVVPGEQSGPSCWWDRAESHEPDPGLARRTETLQAAGDTWARVKREPKTETSLLPTQPSHCTGFSTRVGDPHACTAVFQVFSWVWAAHFMQTRLLTTGVVPEIERMHSRVSSLIWEEAPRNSYGKECVK